ncbi:MAG TPA: dihydroorotate dehydrogenase electron transfer subunit [Thermoanaerobaculaceae bacterium]|nr:dihydroorotate dehydrogenase electron transfer subunit [Thermoanaerobaculaceae bacterium]HRS15868.1 dihydroorotate dehydrogenase electron transfer subunit [Thermoanaerobaculaceae bacterium]
MIARRDLAARVLSADDLTPTAFRLELLCREAVEAVPGQFGMLRCSEGYDPLLRRAFSLAGVRPTGEGWVVEMHIKEVGKGTALLRRLVPGAPTSLLVPLGNGFDLGDEHDLPFALVAGGIGLPPVLFAAEVLAARGRRFDFFFGAASACELYEVERLAAATAAAGGELVLCTDDGTRGEAGFVTAALDRRLAAGRVYGRVLACGPDPMLRALGRLVTARGLAAELSLEEPMACGVGVCLGCVVELEDGRLVPSCKEGPVFSAARLGARWRS